MSTTEPTTITIPTISQKERGWWKRRLPRRAAVTGSIVVSCAAPGSLHALHAGRIEDVGEAAGEEAAQKRKRCAGRTLRNLSDTAIHDRENEEADHGYAEAIEYVCVDGIAPVENDSAENAVERIAQTGAKAQKEAGGRDQRAACGASGEQLSTQP